MSTYRERREGRAARLRESAERNEAKSDAAHEQAHKLGDQIPMGQPILVGHHSERRHRRDLGRIESGLRTSFELANKAEEQARRADEIDRQAANAIYTDDDDAKERLQEKIDVLEAERDRYKAYNASCRKGEADETLLDDKQRANLETIRKHCPYQLGKKGELSYTNLSANINRLRKRLAGLGQDRARLAAGKRMLSRYPGECGECGDAIEKGEAIVYYRSERKAVHDRCAERTAS